MSLSVPFIILGDSRIGMIAEATDLDNNTTLRPQICIAGAGAAGITIATDLANTGLDVILLEGGPLEPSELPDDNEAGSGLYEGSSSGLNIDVSGSRMRVFGGTTNHWAGWCAPLDRGDFLSEGYPNDSEWPIDYEDISPYYNTAQETCDLGGFQYNPKEIADQEDNRILDLDNSQLTNIIYQRSPPTRFGKKYRSEIRDANNVRAYTYANLVDIQKNRDGEKIKQFNCEVIDGPSFTVEADEFVLALGGLENPRLLMASDIGNEMVGQYFMQHPHFSSEAFIALEEFDTSFYQWHTTNTFDETRSEQVETALRGALGLEYNVRKNNNLPNIACTISEQDLEDSQITPDSIFSLPQFDSNDMSLYRLYMRCEQKPIRESQITLKEETDILGIPRIDVDWRLAESDIRRYKDYLKEVGKEFSKIAPGRIWTRLTDDDRFTFESIWGGAHHMGTTKMGAQPDQGVVDENCRLYNVENLYIAGSSVFPTVGYANPTLTIVALAHRLADHLRHE